MDERFDQKILNIITKLHLPYLRINCKTSCFASP